jgi:mRNA interferase MazF
VKPSYIPDAGDLVWLEFDPQSGHEQRGRRPCLVLSPASYNGKVGLMLCCPITSQSRGYPFEVTVTTDQITGVVLADQIKSLDWQARGATFAGSVSEAVLADIRGKLGALITPE